MSIHREAMSYLDKAKNLLARGAEDDLRYAALEMRYCIEHLFYKLIPHYRDYLPDNVHRGDVWRPADIINMIADIDPGITHSRSLRAGFEPAPGVRATTMFLRGAQTGLRRDLARRIYNGLGFYLHARVDGRPHDAMRLRRKLEKILPRLEEFRADRLIMSGFEPRFTFKCEGCDRSLAKRLAAVAADPYVTCPNGQCQAIYEITELGDGKGHCKMIQENLLCTRCSADNWLGIHQWKKLAQENGTVKCRGCPATYELSECYGQRC
jgi:hypothetical protein